MKSHIGLLLLVILISCNNKNDKISVENAPKQMALSKLPNSPAFNQSFSELINAYLSLKDNFVQESDTGIVHSAKALIIASDSLKLNELRADSNLIFTARSYSEGISAELVGLLGEKNMLSKRRSFQMVSDQLYDLIRTVQYNQIILLHAYCTIAFDDQAAYWICKPQDLKNPYLPKEANPCCEIKDTIRYSPIQ